jgi:hypothetical protein
MSKFTCWRDAGAIFYKIPQALARLCVTFPWRNEGLRRRHCEEHGQSVNMNIRAIYTGQNKSRLT